MSATFAGFDILRLDDPAQAAKVARWWDVNAPEMWTQPGYDTRGLDHLPIPAAPKPERAKLNTLVWPVGASRWAVFHCLMAGEDAAKIEAATTQTTTTPACPDGAPFYITVPLSGFAGACGILNGTLVVYLTAPDEWLGTVNGVPCRLVITGGAWVLTLGYDGTVVNPPVEYQGAVSDCCTAATLDLTSSGMCAADERPDTVTATPASTCAGANTVSGELKLTSRTGETVTAQMFVAGMRPVFDLGQYPMYWVTLVDARYFWWQRGETFSFAAGDSWTTLLTNLVLQAAGLTPTFSAAVPAAYGKPSPNRWGRPNVPLPPLIDAAADQVGYRFVYQPDGTCSFRDAAAANTDAAAAYDARKQYVAAGGVLTAAELIGGIPANFVCALWGDNPVYVVKTLTGLSLAEYGALSGVTNAFAWYMSDQRAGTTSPSPDSLATTAATAFYQWALSLYDLVYEDVQAVTLSGNEDRIEWEYVPGLLGNQSPDTGESPVNPAADEELPSRRVLTRVVPSDWGDRNTYGDRVPPGFTYPVKLTEETSAGVWRANIGYVKDGALNYDTNPIPLGFGAATAPVLYGAGAVGQTGIAVPDPLVNNAWVFAPGGQAPTYIVKLTGSGTGPDTGTAWAGKIQHETGGTVGDNGYIGGGSGSAYVMYATKAADGSTGLPEIGDIVVAVPDPDRAGVWEFVPKKVDESGGECNGCCWFVDMDPKACLLMWSLGGDGRCGCVPAFGEESGIGMVYVSDLGGWLGLGMGTTCCGCGGLLFKISPDETVPCASRASLLLRGWHVSCEGGSGSGGGLFDMTLYVECCGVDKATGYNYVVLAGYGPKACYGDKTGCSNVFRFKVRCASCPSPVCTCPVCLPCCSGAAPYAWYGDVTGFSDDAYNGFWVWSPLRDGCKFRGTCTPGSSGVSPTTSTIDSYSTVDGDGFELTHGGSVYQSGVHPGCCAPLTLGKVSGSGPSTIAIKPVIINGECPDCGIVWPETVYATVMSITLGGGATNPFPVGTPIPLARVPIIPPEDWTPQAGWQSAYFPNPYDGGATSTRIQYKCNDSGATGCQGFSVSTDNGWAAGKAEGGTCNTLDCTCTPVYFLGTGTGPGCAGCYCNRVDGCGWGPFESYIDWEIEVTE